jgi:hypothetical protein
VISGYGFWTPCYRWSSASFLSCLRFLFLTHLPGFKSKKGIAAKHSVGIKVFTIPKRSPDLNVLDYSIWKEVNTKMRLQEQKWPSDKRETRNAYLERLRRTALGLSWPYVLLAFLHYFFPLSPPSRFNC